MPNLQMIHNKFKVLTYLGNFVDATRLDQGLYLSNTPHVYEEDATIENQIAWIKELNQTASFAFINDQYIENLKQCELQDAFLMPVITPRNETDLEEHLNSVSIADIRNKLTPFKNLIALLETKDRGSKLDNFINLEIEQCKESIKQLTTIE